MTHKVLLLPGDGIGPEIAAQAARLLKACQEAGLDIDVEEGLVGGSAYDVHGVSHCLLKLLKKPRQPVLFCWALLVAPNGTLSKTFPSVLKKAC